VRIDQTFTVPVARADVASFFASPEKMLLCVPGVTGVSALADGRYRATLMAKVGPIKARFAGEVELMTERLPDELVAVGEGRDAATGSVAKVTLTARLVESEPDLTSVESSSDLTIRGRLGQFGTGVIESIAAEMIDQFSQNVVAVLKDGTEASSAPLSDSPGMTSVALRGLAKDAASRFRGRRGGN
jgi:carbon monoxide dehydrogenase subunit G